MRRRGRGARSAPCPTHHRRLTAPAADPIPHRLPRWRTGRRGPRPREALRADRRSSDGISFAVAAGRAVRPARHERRRQDHHRRDPPGPAPRRRRLGRRCSGLDPAGRRRPAAPADRRPAPGRRPARPHAGRRGAAAVRVAAPAPRPLDELADGVAARRPAGAGRSAPCPAASASGSSWRSRWSAGPELVFLDELTQNLDPVGRRHTWDVVRRVRDARHHRRAGHPRRRGGRAALRPHRRAWTGAASWPTARRRRSSTTSAARPRSRFTDAELDVARRCATCPASTDVIRHGPEVAGGRHAGRCSPTSAPTSSPLGRPRDRPARPPPTLEDRFVALTQEASHQTVDRHRHHARDRPSSAGAAGAPPLGSPRIELRLLGREPMVAVSLIGFPLVTVLVLAGVFGSGPDPEFGGVAPERPLLAGYVGVVLAALGLITLPVHLATAPRARRRCAGSAPRASSGRLLVASEIVARAPCSARRRPSSCWRSGGARLRPPDARGPARRPRLVPGRAGLLHRHRRGPRRRCCRAAAPPRALGNLLFVPMFLLGGGGPPAR